MYKSGCDPASCDLVEAALIFLEQKKTLLCNVYKIPKTFCHTIMGRLRIPMFDLNPLRVNDINIRHCEQVPNCQRHTCVGPGPSLFEKCATFSNSYLTSKWHHLEAYFFSCTVYLQFTFQGLFSRNRYPAASLVLSHGWSSLVALTKTDVYLISNFSLDTSSFICPEVCDFSCSQVGTGIYEDHPE